jgi:hypothetical protein
MKVARDLREDYSDLTIGGAATNESTRAFEQNPGGYRQHVVKQRRCPAPLRRDERVRKVIFERLSWRHSWRRAHDVSRLLQSFYAVQAGPNGQSPTIVNRTFGNFLSFSDVRGSLNANNVSWDLSASSNGLPILSYYSSVQDFTDSAFGFSGLIAEWGPLISGQFTTASDPTNDSYTANEIQIVFGVGDFSIVTDPAAQLAALLTEATGVGPGKSLANKVELAQTYYTAKDVQATCAMLTAFVNEVQAQDGKKIGQTLDAKLIADADAIQAAISCN